MLRWYFRILINKWNLLFTCTGDDCCILFSHSNIAFCFITVGLVAYTYSRKVIATYYYVWNRQTKLPHWR